jgi:hypothetical protein
LSSLGFPGFSVGIGGVGELHAAFLNESRMEFLHIGAKRLIFRPEKLLLMLCFGFVSGHDFSRAVKDRKRIGLQPLPWRILHENACAKTILSKERAQGLKPRSLMGLNGPTEVVP